MRITDQIAYQYAGSGKPAATTLVTLAFPGKQSESNPAQIRSAEGQDDVAVQYLLSTDQPVAATYPIYYQLAIH